MSSSAIPSNSSYVQRPPETSRASSGSPPTPVPDTGAVAVPHAALEQRSRAAPVQISSQPAAQPKFRVLAEAPAVQLAGIENLVPGSQLPNHLSPFGLSVQLLGVPRSLVNMTAESVKSTFVGFHIGSGVHVGNGMVLTARHVYEDDEKEPWAAPKGAFQGRRELYDNRTLRFLPEPGDFEPNTQRRWIESKPLGNINDWALVEDPSLTGKAWIQGVRPTADVQPGEALWVVTGRENSRISAGVFQGVVGQNGVLSDVDVEPGFSGGAVVDARGRLVGIVFSMLSDANQEVTYARFVTTEAISVELAGARKTDPMLPEMKLSR